MRRIILLMLFVFVLLGCRTELCYDHFHGGEVDIKAEWSDDNIRPNELVVYFYRFDTLSKEENLKPIHDYISNIGGSVYLPYGSFESFVYNNNVKGLLFRNTDKYATAEVYLERDNKTPPFASRSHIRSPTTRYVGAVGGFHRGQIDDFMLDWDSPNHSTVVAPEYHTIIVTFKIKVENLRIADLASGTLSGSAVSINLSTGESRIDDTANSVFDFKIDLADGKNDGYIIAEVSCFELLKDHNDDNELQLAFKLKDKEMTELIPGVEFVLPSGVVFDTDGLVISVKKYLTPEIRKKGGEVIIDDIVVILPDIPIVGDEGGGFDADVNEWEDVPNVDLPV